MRIKSESKYTLILHLLYVFPVRLGPFASDKLIGRACTALGVKCLIDDTEQVVLWLSDLQT